MEVFMTDKGRKGLLHRGFHYRLAEVCKKSTRWRCTRKDCTASITTDSGHNAILKYGKDHSHQPPSKHKEEMRAARNSLKRKAIEQSTERPSKLVCREVSSLSTITTKDVENLCRQVRGTRLKTRPKLPKSHFVPQEEEDSPIVKDSAKMSEASTEVKTAINQQPCADTRESVSSNPMEEVDSGEENGDLKESSLGQHMSEVNPMDEIDTEGEDGDMAVASATVVPSNTPVTGDSGQGSPNMQSSSESLSDESQQRQNGDKGNSSADPAGNTAADLVSALTSERADTNVKSAASKSAAEQNGGSTTEAKNKGGKDSKKEEKKEEKKKSKKKEDKGIEYILRALNSLQSPEEKLAALCKKYADLHEEHRVLQSSFKTQQRTMSVVMREKDQLQSEHTKAMMAKSKLESLCRELQKHNKIIKEESLKRAKEDDEKRKEISAQFNSTIGDIQVQMNDNSERNSKLRQENEKLAAQLRTFIQQCEVRDQQVEKLQKQHELEKKLAEAKLQHAEAIAKEQEEKTNKEKELLGLRLAESGKKTAILEAQVSMFKERYDEFEKLHTRSNETFQKYKTEMDKMTKRIKKLEKDGLQWKTKWENTNKALVEQMEARNKAEKDALTQVQKTKKLESLCRALQAELHGKKTTADSENTGTTKQEERSTGIKEESTPEDSTPTSAVPPNSPEASSSDQCSSESSEAQPPSLTDSGAETTSPTPQVAATDASQSPAVPPPSITSSTETTALSSPTQEVSAVASKPDQSLSKTDAPSIPTVGGDVSQNNAAVAPSSSSSSPASSATPSESPAADNAPVEAAA